MPVTLQIKGNGSLLNCRGRRGLANFYARHFSVSRLVPWLAYLLSVVALLSLPPPPPPPKGGLLAMYLLRNVNWRMPPGIEPRFPDCGSSILTTALYINACAFMALRSAVLLAAVDWKRQAIITNNPNNELNMVYNRALTVCYKKAHQLTGAVRNATSLVPQRLVFILLAVTCSENIHALPLTALTIRHQPFM